MDELITTAGIRIDLEEGIPIPLNLSIADFKEPEKRKRNFSKEIDVPGTANNMAFFASSFSLTRIGGAFDFNSSAKVNCVYKKRGATVLPNAVIKLNKVIILDELVTFKAEIFSDFVDIFLLLSNIDIRDLDWSDYDHELTTANVEASWATALGTGYYYPLIERNQRTATTQWKITDMVPYVHLVDVFKKCMEAVGQKYTGNALISTRAKSILYGYGGGNFIDTAVSPTEQNNRKVLLDDGEMTYSKSAIITDPTPYDPSTTVNSSVVFPELFFGVRAWESGPPPIVFTETQDIYNQSNENTFTAKRSGNYKFSISGSLRQEYTGADAFTYAFGGGVYLMYSKNGVNNNILFLDQTSADQTFAIDTSFNVYLNSGDEVVLLTSYGSVNFNDGTVGTSVVKDVTTPVPLSLEVICLETAITEGSIIEVGRFLPSMRCSDFVLGVIKLLNLMISDPDIYGVIDIETMPDFYQGTNVFTDISQEIDISKEIDIRPSANEYAKTLSYLWKIGTETDAKDYVIKWGHGYGNLTFDQPSFFAKGEQKIELPFGTIIPYQITPGLLVPRFVDIDNAGVKKTTAGVPRLMFRNGLKDGEWQLSASVPVNYTTYPCVHHFDDWEAPTFDLNFKLVEELSYGASVVTSDNSYSEYYYTFVNEVISPNGKYVQAYRKINNLQVNKLDWSKLLMWNGALFRFNKIVDFDSEITEVTKIELIKVLDAKTKNRGSIEIPIQVPNIYQKVIIDPSDSVGAGVPVLSGGTDDQILELNKVIRG